MFSSLRVFLFVVFGFLAALANGEERGQEKGAAAMDSPQRALQRFLTAITKGDWVGARALIAPFQENEKSQPPIPSVNAVLERLMSVGEQYRRAEVGKAVEAGDVGFVRISLPDQVFLVAKVDGRWMVVLPAYLQQLPEKKREEYEQLRARLPE